VLEWLFVWSEVQTCIWPSWCHCHSLSFASVKSGPVLPFWYRLTRVVPDKGPLNGYMLIYSRQAASQHVNAIQMPFNYDVMWVQDSWQVLSNVQHIKQYKLQRKDYLAIAICDEDPLICHGRHPPPQLEMFSTTMPSIGGSSTNFPSSSSWKPSNISHAHAHTRLTALFHGLPGWVSTRKIKPVWILLKQETVWAVASAGPYASLQLSPDKWPSQHLTTTGQMPFLPPNQQRQSTEGNILHRQQ